MRDTFGPVWLDTERRAKVGNHSETQSASFAAVLRRREAAVQRTPPRAHFPWAYYVTKDVQHSLFFYYIDRRTGIGPQRSSVLPTRAI